MRTEVELRHAWPDSGDAMTLRTDDPRLRPGSRLRVDHQDLVLPLDGRATIGLDGGHGRRIEASLACLDEGRYVVFTARYRDRHGTPVPASVWVTTVISADPAHALILQLA